MSKDFSDTFKMRVLEIVRAIPQGQALTYGQVAKLAGNEKAARAVGMILSKNFDPSIPCHRVVRADGNPGGYNRGKEQKIKLLKSEKYLS
jgi:O-6-methylguanine DNA methyltransferase